MKNVMKKVFGGVAVFGALAAVFLTVGALSLGFIVTYRPLDKTRSIMLCVDSVVLFF